MIDELIVLTEFGARDETPEDAHGTGSALLPAPTGGRIALRPRRQDRPPRSQTGQHVPLGEHDRQNRRFRTGRPTPRRLQSVSFPLYTYIHPTGQLRPASPKSNFYTMSLA